jgi:hypothetical protein
MNDIDELIKQALCEDDARWFNELEEQSMREMVVESFRGKMRWLVVLVYFWIGTFALLALISGIQLLRTEDPRIMLLMAVGFLFCCVSVAMLKVWYWIELSKKATIREMKRIELQLARLSARRA